MILELPSQSLTLSHADSLSVLGEARKKWVPLIASYTAREARSSHIVTFPLQERLRVSGSLGKELCLLGGETTGEN